MSAIRHLGAHPCPRCLIPLSRVQRMGMTQDMAQRRTLARIDDHEQRNKIQSARAIIYEGNYAVDNERVENLLKTHSLVPTEVRFLAAICNSTLIFHQSAFSKKLGPLGLNAFLLWVIDMMHEFELGVWKALFIHLLRILQSVDKSLLNELDRRYVLFCKL